MKTELLVQQPEIQPGLKIEVLEHAISNFRLHNGLDHLARLMVYLIEMDSNNTTSVLTPENKSEVYEQLNLFEQEINFAKNHNSAPAPSHEADYKLLLPKGSEIQRISNVKAKRVAKEVDLLLRVGISLDSAGVQTHVKASDFTKLESQLNTVKSAIELWFGRSDELDNFGLEVPAMVSVGELQPDVDVDYASLREPSSAVPATGLPDVADVERTK